VSWLAFLVFFSRLLVRELNTIVVPVIPFKIAELISKVAGLQIQYRSTSVLNSTQKKRDLLSDGSEHKKVWHIPGMM
jgi:hypothetical protein